jgi:hypothetical protein
LADDEPGRQRETVSTPLDDHYLAAFKATEADANQCRLVAVESETVIGTLQLSFFPASPAEEYGGAKSRRFESRPPSAAAG